MNDLSMARSLMGSIRSNAGQTTTAYGIASGNSADGLVMVDMGGDTVSTDDDQSIECETTFKVYEGDEVIVSLIGADGTGKTPIVIGVVGRGDEDEEKVEALRNRATELANEIIESATETYNLSVGRSTQLISEITIAKTADYSTFVESIQAKIDSSASNIREEFTNEISVMAGGINGRLEEYYQLFSGEIKRGFIELPNSGGKVFGIVVSSQDVFKANSSYVPGNGDENTYYEIDIESEKCFGFYTSTGWQFWKGKNKLGWFDISDGKLHVTRINIDQEFMISDWRIVANGTSWGVKYIGGD